MNSFSNSSSRLGVLALLLASLPSVAPSLTASHEATPAAARAEADISHALWQQRRSGASLFRLEPGQENWRRDAAAGQGTRFTAASVAVPASVEVETAPLSVATNDGGAILTEPVNIPDALLRQAIAEGLGKDAGETITTTEMETLTGLRASYLGIADLTGLSSAVNLE